MNVQGLPQGRNGTDSINKKLPTQGTAVCSVKAAGKLTVDTQVTAEDTMTVDGVLYTFKAGATAAANQIGIGANVAACLVAIVAALDGSDTFNTAQIRIDVPAAFTGDDLVLTAKNAGTYGNAIPTVSSFTTGTNLFDAVVLGTEAAGVDGTSGEPGDQLIDASYLYVCVEKDTVAGNWRRISLGSAY